MKFKIIAIAFFCALFLKTATAQSPITLTIDPNVSGMPIPPDFTGLSFETGALRYNNYRTDGYLFDSSNTQFLTLFKNLGINSLRIGGNSVDRGSALTTNDLDAFFRFVKAGDLKVIYSLRLANGNADEDASIAKYIWGKYRPYLICLAIGNEANSYNGLDPEMTNSATFIAKWNKFASAVTSAVPDVVLGGPDNGNGSFAWASDFARAERGNKNLACIFSHYEPGGPGKYKTTAQLVNEMLSPAIDDKRCPDCYEKLGVMARSLGFSYRFTEANTQVAPPLPSMHVPMTRQDEEAARRVKAADLPSGNHTFSTALFALDFMHWWAAHGCLSVHFHTGLKGFNAGLHLGTNGDYEPYPISYGIAAFSIGGHGSADSMAIKNPDNVDLTAYAVTDTNNNLFVTIINKEHGTNARNATVTINACGKSAGVIYLKAPNDDVTETSGVTLGGSTIDDSSPWQGKWDSLDSTGTAGCDVNVETSSAAIVKITGAKVIEK